MPFSPPLLDRGQGRGQAPLTSSGTTLPPRQWLDSVSLHPPPPTSRGSSTRELAVPENRAVVTAARRDPAPLRLAVLGRVAVPSRPLPLPWWELLRQLLWLTLCFDSHNLNSARSTNTTHIIHPPARQRCCP